jgi:signal recognition particle receptor subunit alpha
MASLDFSVDKSISDDNNTHPHDVQNLVNQSSFGTRTRDGFYEVKDWEFNKEKQNSQIIAQALTAKESVAASTSSSLGALGSLFARLTGSKILTEKDLQPVLEGMKQHLMKKNVAREISEKICESVGKSLIGKKVGGFQSD